MAGGRAGRQAVTACRLLACGWSPDACCTPCFRLWRVARRPLHALHCMVSAAQDASRGLTGMAHIVHVALWCMRILSDVR